MSNEPRISPIFSINPQMIRNLQQAAQSASQVKADEDLSQYFELSTFSPLLQTQRFRSLAEMKTHLSHHLEEIEDAEELQILDVEKPDEAAARFQKNNDELNARSLMILRARLSGDVAAEEIMNTTLEFYNEPALADEALDFLIRTTPPEKQGTYKKAKELLNSHYELEIRAGRNIGAQARAFAKEGLGNPTSLRELYKEILYQPREAIVLFDQLADRFPYAKLQPTIYFLLNSLGTDFRSRGPSISRPELKRLIDEIRSLQGILGVYRFFLSRMSLIKTLFAKFDVPMNPRIYFEVLARVFIKILGEKFINPDRILSTADPLGLKDFLMGKIIIYRQMADALKQVAPRYFRNQKHKEELIKSFSDALGRLEKEKEEKEKKKNTEEEDDE